MGYHITILRTKESTVVPIGLEEVQAATQAIGGWQYVENDSAFVKKNGHENSCVIWYNDGELWAKNPSQWALEQMIALSLPLQARVRGDEFETYETVDKCYNHPDDVKLKIEAIKTSEALLVKNRKEQQLIRLVIIGLFILLGIVAFIVGKSFEK